MRTLFSGLRGKSLLNHGQTNESIQSKTFFSKAKDKMLIKYLLNLNFIIYRQSPVKNQPINHKVDNFHVLTKVPHNTRETLQGSHTLFIFKGQYQLILSHYYYNVN